MKDTPQIESSELPLDETLCNLPDELIDRCDGPLHEAVKAAGYMVGVRTLINEWNCWHLQVGAFLYQLKQTAEDVPGLTYCQCGNCGWRGPMQDLRAQLDEVECGLERLDPGSVVPAGECPNCGAFAYIDDGEQRLRDASMGLLCSLQSCAEMLEEMLRTAASNDQADAIDLVLSDARAAIAKATGKAQP